MKSNYLIGTVVCILFAGLSVASAAERRGDQGLGLVVGSPIGLTWKMWVDDEVALDTALGANSEVALQSSFLWHNFGWSRRAKDRFVSNIASNGEFPYYIGGGFRLLFDDENEFGLRFPFGLAFFPNETKWEFFGELAPILRITPDVGFNGQVAVGARYYFPAIRPRGGK